MTFLGHAACSLMIDKITTVPQAKLEISVGRLNNEDSVRPNLAVVVWLGLAGPGT